MSAPIDHHSLHPATLAPPILTVGEGASDAEYAAFLAMQPDATPFHTAAWGRAIEGATGNRWHLLTVRDADGALTGVLPLHHIRSRLFGDALASAGFAVGGGILASDVASAAMLADSATKLATQSGVGSLELRGGAVPTGHGWHSKGDVYAGFVTDLAADDEAQLLAIPRKQRAEVRKALARDLTVRTGTSAADRADHYAVYAQSVRNLGTPVFPRALFGAVLDALGDDGADILTIYDGARPVASVLSLYWRGTVMPYWGGGTADARASRANERMYHALMLDARARGCTRFDFGRSKVGTGPYAYKKNWGFEPQPLTYGHWTADGAAPRDINPLSPKYRLKIAAWQKLPLWAANRIGPLLARGLG